MLRVIITLSLFFLNIYACQGGYNSCINKLKHSNSLQNNTLSIPIKNNKRLVFSRSKPKDKILKHDPFLSLYLIEDKHPFKYPFKINMREPSGIALISTSRASEIKIIKKQIGLNNFAEANVKIQKLAIVSNSCCSLEGIATKRGIIDKAYIKRFIEKKDIRYGDIGIQVKNKNKMLCVVSYNPFMKNNPFEKGDYILSLNGHKSKDSASFMQKILFSKIGTLHTLKIKRNNKIMTINVKSEERLSGGYLVQTYLEKYGLSFDENLYIKKIDTNKKEYGLILGDKLLKVNNHYVNNQEDVMKYVSDFKKRPKLLFERKKSFQFFVDMD